MYTFEAVVWVGEVCPRRESGHARLEGPSVLWEIGGAGAPGRVEGGRDRGSYLAATWQVLHQ